MKLFKLIAKMAGWLTACIAFVTGSYLGSCWLGSKWGESIAEIIAYFTNDD